MGNNALYWGQSLTGRLQGQNLWANLETRAAKFFPRLEAELQAGVLPFISMPYRARLETELPRIMESFGKNIKHMLLLGIGGSALGARALQKAFMPGQDWPGHAGPWLWIADNIDADSFSGWLDRLPPKDTLVVVISKSGGTIETMSQYFLVRDWLFKKLGLEWTKQVLIITDEKTGALREEVTAKNLPSLPVPDHLGGRYSVLSSVGLVPAYFCGIDWKGLLNGAAGVMEPLVKNPAFLGSHPAWRIAVWAKALLDNNYNQLIFFNYIPSWSYFSNWFAQLWAESLGKSGKGSMPISATGVTDQHSVQQMFLDGPKDKGCLFIESLPHAAGPHFDAGTPDNWSYLKGKAFSELLFAEGIGTRGAFAAQNIPLVRMEMGQAKANNAGKLVALLGLATIFTGWLLEINPLDQPAVELGKRLANARLGASGYTSENKALEQYFAVPDEKQSF